MFSTLSAQFGSLEFQFDERKQLVIVMQHMLTNWQQYWHQWEMGRFSYPCRRTNSRRSTDRAQDENDCPSRLSKASMACLPSMAMRNM